MGESIQKLNPARYEGMSGKMAALVGYILDQEFTNPDFQF